MLRGFLYAKWKSISIWRRILLVVFLTGSIICIAPTTMDGVGIFEFSVAIFNDPIFICYIMLFAQLLITADTYASSIYRNFDDYLVLYVKGVKRWVFYNYIFLAIESIVLLFAIIAVAWVFFFSSLAGNNAFQNIWISITGISNNVSPFNGFLLSLLFGFLRILFLSLLTFQINLLSKHCIGFLGCVSVTLIDRFLYEAFDIMQPLKITLLEHTRVLYTEAVAPAWDNPVRTGYLQSVLIWLILIILLLLSIMYFAKQKNFFTYDSDNI